MSLKSLFKFKISTFSGYVENLEDLITYFISFFTLYIAVNYKYVGNFKYMPQGVFNICSRGRHTSIIICISGLGQFYHYKNQTNSAQNIDYKIILYISYNII